MQNLNVIKKYQLLVILAVTVVQSFAQTGKVVGYIKDAKTQEALSYTAVAVYNLKDSTLAKGAITDTTGYFVIEPLKWGTYYLKISYVGYDFLNTQSFPLNEAQPIKDFGKIKLKPVAATLKAATVVAKQILFEQKGDTIQYHADAFKTHPDATAEDLVTKMPGVTTDGGTVKVNGEQVQQVLVDGKPFFGDDPNMALKNLPAEVIDKIQVFDKLSDQAQFTGFDDGNTTKTINITTKQGKNNGQFGKVYFGYGEDDRYLAGGNLNIFNGERRISLLGLSNNINQQNFSTQDLTGALGGGGGGRGGRGGGAQGGGGGAASNFLVSQQNGVATTNSFGLNYSDKWGKDIKVTGSYFFNRIDNTAITGLTRNYVTGKTGGLVYNENDTANNSNFNHRINFRFEYTIDSANSLIITPKFNYQLNNATSSVFGLNTLPEDIIQSRTGNNTTANGSGYDFANTIVIRHKLKKRGRTFSIGFTSDLNEKNGTGSLYSISQYALNDTTLSTPPPVDQHYTQYSKGYTLSPNLVYTEPVDSFSQLQINYTPAYTISNNNKETFNRDIFTQDYSSRDTALSNLYASTYISNKAGLGYRRNKKKYNFMLSANYQYATLSGSETFPYAYSSYKSFSDILPQAMFNYKFSKGTNLRVMYRTSTNIPSISQLQSVVNNSNPLLLSTGNPDLKQDYEQTLTLRYGKTNAGKSSGLFVYAFANYAMNYIGNSTFIPVKDTLINSTLLKRGSQLVRPVNINGYWNTRTFLTYGIPISKIKCNLNLNAGFNYACTPGLINSVTNLANNYGMSGGLGLSSNISEKLDFNFSSTANYNIVQNTLQNQLNNTYYSQTTSFKLNWIFLGGVVFNTSLNHTYYNGLSQGYNQNYLLWNAYMGYKFFKNKSLEAKVSLFDILNQNKNININVTDTYIENSRTNVLTRYFMATLTYTLRNFKGAAAPPADKPTEENPWRRRD